MKRLIIAISYIFLPLIAHAQQSIAGLMSSIEANNPSLQAAMKQVEVLKAENLGTALLPGLEVEFNYLWGHTPEVGQRRDMKISQSFDIPTLTGMRKTQAGLLDDMALLSYRAARQEILLRARLLCIDLVYCNARLKELNVHKAHAEKLSRAMERKMELGGADILECNKSRLHLSSVQTDIARTEVERQGILSELRLLNGGIDTDYPGTAYDEEEFPENFASWYAEAEKRSPVLGYIRGEISSERNQLRIDRTAWLPELTVGYMAEIGNSDRYRGLTVGLSVPLWSNANKVRRTRAMITEAEYRRKEAQTSFHENLRQTFDKAAGLKRIVEQCRISLGAADNREQLLEAESKGEISMVDYIVETDMYYDALEQTLAAERDYRKALAQLHAVYF